jgi:hypothetical protein
MKERGTWFGPLVCGSTSGWPKSQTGSRSVLLGCGSRIAHVSLPIPKADRPFDLEELFEGPGWIGEHHSAPAKAAPGL